MPQNTKNEKQELSSLYRKVDLCPLCKNSQNELQHILGTGKIRPRFLLLLINPTYKNISSRPEYKGPRFPFVGVRSFWRVLGKAGLINQKLAESLPLPSLWQKEHTISLQEELLKNSLFLTNIVKCTFSHSLYPPQKYFEYHREILKKELEIVKPKYIVAFGQLPFKFLTGKSIVLSSIFESKDHYKPKHRERITHFKIPVLPCYFPVGRGKPKEAIAFLSFYNTNFF